MAFPKPEAGLVIRCDFLWKDEHDAVQDYGRKDRPCAIVLASKRTDEQGHTVVVCPITHAPPDDPATAVEVPMKVANYLKLAQERCWIRTHEINTFKRAAGRVSAGVVPAGRNRSVFGFIPPGLHATVSDLVLAQRARSRLSDVNRD